MKCLTTGVVFAVLGSVLSAQVPRREFDPVGDCPWPSPRLSSAVPAEVAWACEQLAVRAEGQISAEEQRELLQALQRLRSDESPEGERAVLHVLHALRLGGAMVPRSELMGSAAGRTEVARLDLQLRAASAEGGELLELFQRLDPERDVAWEVVGGALALRLHRTFAAELWLGLRPTLRVTVGGRAGDGAVVVPTRDKLPTNMTEFPPPPLYGWQRDQHGLVYAGWKRALIKGQQVPLKDEAKASAVFSARARIRWLAALAGKGDAGRWPMRFELAVPMRDKDKVDQLEAEARQRAEAALVEIAAGLKERKLVPEARAAKVPVLTVEREQVAARPAPGGPVKPGPERGR